jgi:hypothetical protein
MSTTNQLGISTDSGIVSATRLILFFLFKIFFFF